MAKKKQIDITYSNDLDLEDESILNFIVFKWKEQELTFANPILLLSPVLAYIDEDLSPEDFLEKVIMHPNKYRCTKEELDSDLKIIDNTLSSILRISEILMRGNKHWLSKSPLITQFQVKILNKNNEIDYEIISTKEYKNEK